MSETTVVKGQFGLVQSGGTGKKLKNSFFLQMSNLQKPTNYSKNGLNNQILNTYVNIHDLNCGCDNALKHIVLQILEKEPEIKKCLTTTTTGETTGDGEEDVLGEGDLERFFAEDFGEDVESR